jgi:hypothetical protein
MRSRRVARPKTGNRSEISTRFPFPRRLSPPRRSCPLCHPCSDRGFFCDSSVGFDPTEVRVFL